MNVVFFYQHYWPDSPPYASMLRTIGESLQSQEVNVHILTGHPSYKSVDRKMRVRPNELMNGVSVQRLPSLWGIEQFKILQKLQKILFPIRAFLSLIFQRYVLGKKIDVVVAATIPPVLNGGFAWLSSKLVGAKFVYHLQDIYPEIGVTSGLWNERSLIARILRTLDTFICKRAHACVVLSEDMRASLVRRGVDSDSISVINNFLLDSHEKIEIKDASDFNIEYGAVNIVFAGNLGRFQGLNDVLDGFLHWQKNHSNPIRETMYLHFLGEGSEKANLLARSNGNANVIFHKHLPFSEASQFIQACDAGIVSLNRGVYKYAFPSKILTYLGLGVPIFAMVEPDSEISHELKSNNLGVVCRSQSADQISLAFEKMHRLAVCKEFETARILKHYQKHLASEVALGKWKELIEVVTSNPKNNVKPL